MPHVVFSAPWVEAWAGEIRSSEEYRQAAQRWQWPLMFVLRAGHPDLPESRVYLDLFRGECREARLGTPEDDAGAAFVLTADSEGWKEVLEGRLDPVAAIMQGRVKLAKGNVMALAMHTAAARALVQTATRVDSVFPETS